MKFDIIVGNPPYQELKEGNTNSKAIWPSFVERSVLILKEGGYLNMVHPSGWRDVDGMFVSTKSLLSSRQMIYLEIHNEKDGIKTFGAETRYDFYCLRNNHVKNFKTKVVGQNLKSEEIDISKMQFIPNSNLEIINSLIAKNGEDSVNILADCNYHTQRDYVSNESNETYNLPVIYTVKNKDIPTFKYSSIKRGHFGIPKLIWSNGRIISIGCIIDATGEYGLTNFSYAIVDDVENLPSIKMAFDNKRFRSLMEDCAMKDLSVNRRILALFRKDFWKGFIN